MLVFRLSGVLLLRFVARRLIGLLFQDPPRRTVARPRISAPRGRRYRRHVGGAPQPADDEPPELVDEAGGVLVLVHADESQLTRESQMSPQQRQLEVGCDQRRPITTRAVKLALKGESRVLDLAREYEPLRLRELAVAGRSHLSRS